MFSLTRHCRIRAARALTTALSLVAIVFLVQGCGDNAKKNVPFTPFNNNNGGFNQFGSGACIPLVGATQIPLSGIGIYRDTVSIMGGQTPYGQAYGQMTVGGGGVVGGGGGGFGYSVQNYVGGNLATSGGYLQLFVTPSRSTQNANVPQNCSANNPMACNTGNAYSTLADVSGILQLSQIGYAQVLQEALWQGVGFGNFGGANPGANPGTYPGNYPGNFNSPYLNICVSGIGLDLGIYNGGVYGTAYLFLNGGQAMSAVYIGAY